MSDYLVATEVTALAGGRSPAWKAGKLTTIIDEPPVLANAGFQCDAAMLAFVRVSPQEVPNSRAAYISVPVYDAGTTYRIYVNGSEAEVAAGEGSADAVVDAFKVLIDASLVALGLASSDIVETADSFGRVHTYALRIRGLRTIKASVSGGTGTIAAVADATSCYVQLYALPNARAGSTAPTQWDALGEPYAVLARGDTRRITVAGYSRVAAHVLAGGHADDGLNNLTVSGFLSFGPALSEDI